jgi:hypothetical protein
MSTDIRPYQIAVRDDILQDLKARLRNTRWPEAELVGDWSQGAPLAWIQDICRYWAGCQRHDGQSADRCGGFPQKRSSHR